VETCRETHCSREGEWKSHSRREGGEQLVSLMRVLWATVDGALTVVSITERML
jgi:hypothetical protein